MKSFTTLVALVALCLFLAAPVGAQQSQNPAYQSYPYQTPGTQGLGYNTNQGYWNRYYGVPQSQGYQTQMPYAGQYQSPGQRQYESTQYQPAQSQAQQQQYYQRGENQYTAQSSQGSSQQIRGRIVRTKRLEVPGSDEEIVTALLETNQGRVVADLGPCEELRENNCQIHKGDQISAWGHFTRVGNGYVFVADSLRKDGHTVEIDRTWTVTTQQLRNEANAMQPYASSSSQQQSQQGGQQSQQYQQGQQGTQSRQGSRYYQGTSSQDGYQQEDQQQGSRRSYRSSQQDGGSSQQFSGRVMRAQRIDLPGMQTEMLLAHLQTDDGQQMCALLGPENELQDVRVNKGDQITVRGPQTWVSGHPLILAQQVTGANGQSAQVSMQRSPSQRISGEVTKTAWIQLPGMRHEILVTCLKTEQGRKVIAVLGPEDSLGNHEPQRGDEVSLRGDLLNVSGQQVILAQQLTKGGEQVNFNNQPR
jgi:hypothetical protein